MSVLTENVVCYRESCRECGTNRIDTIFKMRDIILFNSFLPQIALQTVAIYVPPPPPPPLSESDVIFEWSSKDKNWNDFSKTIYLPSTKDIIFIIFCKR